MNKEKIKKIIDKWETVQWYVNALGGNSEIIKKFIVDLKEFYVPVEVPQYSNDKNGLTICDILLAGINNVQSSDRGVFEIGLKNLETVHGLLIKGYDGKDSYTEIRGKYGSSEDAPVKEEL